MSRGIFTLLAFILTGAVLIAQVVRLTRIRRPNVTVANIILAGPLLFIYPARYFRHGQLSAPWRTLLWFILWLLVTALVGRSLGVGY